MKLIRINELDNVAVALTPIAKGETIPVGNTEITAKEDIRQGHKISLDAIPENCSVIKYGSAIGHTTGDIQPGC